MPNKILIPLQSLISYFLEPLQTSGWRWEQVRDSGGATLSQRHYMLSPSSCYPSQWGFFVLNLLCAKDQANENCEHRSGI